MDTSDNNKKDSNENNSVLFKLWQRTKQRKEAAEASEKGEGSHLPPQSADAPSQAAAVKPEAPAPAPFRPKGANAEDYVQMLWGFWSKTVPNAPEYTPSSYWDEAIKSGAVKDSLVIARDQSQFYDQISQIARGDYESTRSVIAANQAERKAVLDAKINAEQKMQKALRDAKEEGEDAAEVSSEEFDAALKAEQELVDAPLPVIDAKIVAKISADKMLAWVFILPEQNGGAGITAEGLAATLASANITFGIDDGAMKQALAGVAYFKLLLIARGTPPINGTDGYITNKISDQWEIKPQQNPDGTVDFKNIGTIHNIVKGTVLCNIVPPTEAVEGMSVDGNVVAGLQGKEPKLPQGTNTEISPEGTALVAAEDGHVVIEGDKFAVKTTLAFSGDIDNAVGNLTFPGNITVMGDVREGFEVNAHGDVNIKGMVEGAKIISGSNITLERGMNGNGRGVLEAQGNIQTKFLENCTVYAKGSISAGSIICSDVSCDDVLTVRSGKGVIIGGQCTVRKSIDAKAIGNESNRITVVSVGNSSGLIEKKKELEQTIKVLTNQLDEIKKTMVYVVSSNVAMSADRMEKIRLLREQAPLIEMQTKELTEQLSEVSQAMLDVMDSRIKCDTIYPPSKISIGLAKCNVEEIHTRCNIYYSEGEVIFGSQ